MDFAPAIIIRIIADVVPNKERTQNMKKAIRFFSLLLALLMAAAVFASCGETANENTSGTTAQASQTDDGKFHPENFIPKDNLDGHEFKIISSMHDWAICEMTGEEISGDVIQDAIYNRQLQVENHLNVKLTQSFDSSPAGKLQTTAAASGDDAYDLGLCPTYDALTLYIAGVTVDQNSVDSLHFEQPWWETGFMSAVNLRDKKYISFGNASLVYYSSFYIYCFNKEMIGSYNLENPYDLVTSGDWTWDKAYEMMKVVATDTDADGISTPKTENDILGLTGHINHSRNLMCTSGFTVCEKDAEGNLTFNGLSESYVDAYTKYLNYFITNPAVAISGSKSNRYNGYESAPGIKNYVNVFVQGRSLFLTTGTNEVTTIRESQNEYGIVVVPKYSKDQKTYITPVYSATLGFVVPVASGDVERTGKVLEALNGFSYKNLIDKHISIVLHYRVANDPTAIAMINKAYENGSIDISMANNIGTCTSLLNNLHINEDEGVGRMFNGVKAAIQTDIKNKLRDVDAKN